MHRPRLQVQVKSFQICGRILFSVHILWFDPFTKFRDPGTSAAEATKRRNPTRRRNDVWMPQRRSWKIVDFYLNTRSGGLIQIQCLPDTPDNWKGESMIVHWVHWSMIHLMAFWRNGPGASWSFTIVLHDFAEGFVQSQVPKKYESNNDILWYSTRLPISCCNLRIFMFPPIQVCTRPCFYQHQLCQSRCIDDLEAQEAYQQEGHPPHVMVVMSVVKG